MRFTVCQLSLQGGRALNEDRLDHHSTGAAVLLVLADGMGGHPEGEMAAEIAVQTFVRRFNEAALPTLPDPRAFLEETVCAASQAIVDYARQRKMDDNPRTTAVAAVVQAGQLTVLHSGDSRLYWVRQGELVQRTRDHTYHDKPELFGRPPPELNRSVLFTCLGSDAAPLYDVLGPMPLHDGDRLLLCSDGLWSVMRDDEVTADLDRLPLQEAVSQLADDAVRRGGRHGDNVSVLGFDWESEDDFETTQLILPLGGLGGLGDNGPATVQADGADVPRELADFDEDAIERTIAEINDAIRRTAGRKPV